MAQDFLNLCNSMNVPLEDFKGQFCNRCLNTECVRSIVGKSGFDQRVATWQQRLFTEVPQLGPEDPRFVQISAKKFLGVEAGPIPEIGATPVKSAWIDPRNLDEASERVQKVEASPPVLETVQEPVVAEAPKAESVVSRPEPKTTTPLIPMNTPHRPKQMLANAPSSALKTPSPVDPWATPTNPETAGVKVIQPGARIRFGS